MADARYTHDGEPTVGDLALCLGRIVEDGEGLSGGMGAARQAIRALDCRPQEYNRTGMEKALDSFWSRGAEAGNDNEPAMPDSIAECWDEAGVLLWRGGYRELDEVLWNVLWEAQRYTGDWQKAEECFPGLAGTGWVAETDPYWAEQLEAAKAKGQGA